MSLLSKMRERLEELDRKCPAYISAQLVKDVFDISTGQATLYLELAGRAGQLTPRYHVRCPTCDAIIGQYDYKFQIPKRLHCHVSDEHEDFDAGHHLRSIQKVYVLNGS